MQALLIVINILLVLNAIVLIVCVLMQEGNRAGLGAIGGGAETFFGKSKAKGVEAKLELITKIGAAVFIVLAIVATAMTARMGNNAQTTVPLELPVVEATVAPEAEATVAPEAEATVAPEAEATVAPAAEATVAPAAEATVAPVAEATVAPVAEATVAPAAPVATPAA